jgi:hypothetical protein
VISFNFLSKAFSAVSPAIVENFFNAMAFYMNTPGYCIFGYIPIYIRLGDYIGTFSP